MKKLLFIHHSSIIGGAGISGLNVLKSLDATKFSVKVYLPFQEDNSIAALYDSNGFETIQAKNSPIIFSHFSGGEKSVISPFFWKNIYELTKDRSKIKQLLINEEPDVVVLNSMTLFWIAPLAKKRNIRVLLFFRETYGIGFLGLRNAIIRLYLRHYIDKISFISDYENALTPKEEQYKNTIYNAIDGSKFSDLNKLQCRNDLNLNQDEFHILYVGGLISYKGPLILLQALKELAIYNNIHLLFLGFSEDQLANHASKLSFFKKVRSILGLDYRKKCLDFIENNNLRDKISFISHVSDTSKFFKASDCVAIPMTRPHQARPIFEAGFAKTPVVVSDFKQIRSLYDDDSVYFFETQNAQSLFKSIEDVYLDRVKAENKVNNNYKITVERHSLDKFSNEIKLFFKSEE